MADKFVLPLAAEEKTALASLLRGAIDGDRYPLSPRIGVLKSVLARLQPLEPSPVLCQRYAQPRATAAQRRLARGP